MKLDWRPTNSSPTELNFHESVVAALADAGFPLPCTLTDDDLPILRGMAAVAADSHPYRTLMNLIVQHDSIALSLSTTE